MFTTKNGLYERARQRLKISDGIKLFSYPFYKQRRNDVQVGRLRGGCAGVCGCRASGAYVWVSRGWHTHTHTEGLASCVTRAAEPWPLAHTPRRSPPPPSIRCPGLLRPNLQ